MLANKRTVFVGNIPFNVGEDKVREIFKQIGPIKTLRLVVEKDSGMPKGYGFCEFFEEHHAIAAINSLDQQEINGRRIKVDSAEGSKDQMEDEEGLRISSETKKEIDAALRKMTLSEVYDIVSELKMMIQRDRDHVYNLLKSKPVLAQALFTAQLMLGMAQISASTEGADGAPSIPANIDPEEQAVIAQVLSLTQEDIDRLDPEGRERVMEIRRLHMRK